MEVVDALARYQLSPTEIKGHEAFGSAVAPSPDLVSLITGWEEHVRLCVRSRMFLEARSTKGRAAANGVYGSDSRPKPKRPPPPRQATLHAMK